MQKIKSALFVCEPGQMFQRRERNRLTGRTKNDLIESHVNRRYDQLTRYNTPLKVKVLPFHSFNISPTVTSVNPFFRSPSMIRGSASAVCTPLWFR